VGLLVTCEERCGSEVFVTTLVLGAGRVAASYRKRRATRAGAQAVFFEAAEGLQGSILICFDAENADVRDEAFCGPLRRSRETALAVFNPTHIRALESAPAWRTALSTMHGKFAKRCGDEAVLLMRCDQPAPSGAGSSQLIGPDGSVSCASAGPCVLNVFISPDASNRLSRHLKARVLVLRCCVS
jgi:predicted amidohydrolase